MFLSLVKDKSFIAVKKTIHTFKKNPAYIPLVKRLLAELKSYLNPKYRSKSTMNY